MSLTTPLNPSEKTELILIRHAVTEANLRHVMLGRTNPPLHPLGIEQAQAIAQALVKEHWHTIYTSPLLRAMQTAEIIAQARSSQVHQNIVPLILPGLAEIDLGVIDGLPSYQAYQEFREVMDQALDPEADDFAFSGGESRVAVHQRFYLALQEIVHRHPGQQVCAVTHGGALGLWFARSHQEPLGHLRQRQPQHASITRVIHENDAWQIAQFNDVSHLPTALQQAIKELANQGP
ncbi:histidine phosphatase family protein [Alicyclobacillaceae bacterium I2511]|nr:histidine phosphatase family protein [Alicyclobacillaceae bacterium I2511]